MDIDEIICAACRGTGSVPSGVCYCGDYMEGHSMWDNHSPTEMDEQCEACLHLHHQRFRKQILDYLRK
jgi:hypothetical protein